MCTTVIQAFASTCLGTLNLHTLTSFTRTSDDTDSSYYTLSSALSHILTTQTDRQTTMSDPTQGQQQIYTIR